MRVWRAWQQFWFRPVDLRFVGLFRFLLGLTIFVLYLIRFQDRDILHYENGLVSADLAREFLPEFYRSPLQWVPGTDTMVLWVSIAYLTGIVVFTLGILDRVFTWLLLFLHLSLMQRNFTVIYGVELIVSFWLFYLGFIRHGQYFSLCNCWREKTWRWSSFTGWSHPAFRDDLLSSMAVRLIQVQLCVIYGFTGLEKLRGTSWWDGSAVWKVLGNAQLAPVDFSLLAHFPVTLGLLTTLTVLFEIYFPIVVWIPTLRRPWLLYGALFHGGAALMMGLPFFSLVMIAAYLVFLTPFQKTQ